MHAASRLAKLCARPAQMRVAKSIIVPESNAGREPKYKVIGTQTKTYRR